MHPVLQKSFGGLSRQYYVRQLFFGLLFAGLILSMASRGPQGLPMGLAAVMAVNAFLYPYSRFVYERIVGFILGENVFFVNAILMLFVKAFTMAMCFSFVRIPRHPGRRSALMAGSIPL